MLKRHAIFIIMFSLLSAPAPSSAFAGETLSAVETGRVKINLSGRQRMLSQRMAGASCMAMAGLDVDHRIAVAEQSHADFDRALHGMQFGDEGLKLPVEKDAGILAAFSEVESLWAMMGPAVLQLAYGDLQNVVVRQLLDLNIPLLTTSNEAVTRIVERYGAGVVDPAMATTINVAGRQRMLSQKMMKEACFVAVGLNAEHYAEELKKTMALFDRSLGHLQQGSDEAGIVAPPSPEVKNQLEKVAKHWEAYRTTLSLIEKDSARSVTLLVDLGRQGDALLVEMHKAVLLYVAA